MSDREKLLKQWRNLPIDQRVTWEVFKRQQRPTILRKSRPEDNMAEVDRCEALTTQHLN